MYTARLSPSDLRERLATLDEARNTLSLLIAQTEKAQNKQLLNASLEELDKLQTLLPTPITPGGPAASAPAPPPPAAPTHGPRAAELVAARLQRLVAEIRQAIATSWASTEATEEAARTVDAERERSLTAEIGLKRMWQHAFGLLLLDILGSAFLAFLLLAMTDLTKALLDAATHSGVVADAYRAAAAPAAEAYEQPYDPPYEPEIQS